MMGRVVYRGTVLGWEASEVHRVGKIMLKILAANSRAEDEEKLSITEVSDASFINVPIEQQW